MTREQTESVKEGEGEGEEGGVRAMPRESVLRAHEQVCKDTG